MYFMQILLNNILIYKFTQIDELLSEVNIDYNSTTRLENALHNLKQIFEDIEDKPELMVN